MSQRLPGGIDPARLRPGQNGQRGAYSQHPQRSRAVAFDPREGSRMPTHVPGIEHSLPTGNRIVVANQPPTQFMRVAGFGAIPIGTQGADQTVEWRFDGRVIGLQCHARNDGSARGQSSLALRIQAGAEQSELCVQGNSGVGDWITFAGLVGLNPLTVAPFYRDVCRNDRWTVSCFNYDTVTAYTPEVVFHVAVVR